MACKIFLIPLNEYVYIHDSILPEEDDAWWGDIERYGKWTEHVSSLIDEYKSQNKIN